MTQVVEPDEVSPEWLTEVLATNTLRGSAKVAACVVEPMKVASFTGVFRRLELGYDSDIPTLPRSLIAKFSTPDPEGRAAMHGMGFYGREIAFYRELAAETPVPVPICYYAAIDDRDGRCVILLEDLTGSRRGRSTDSCSAAEARQAVDAIARLHASWWQSPDLESWPWLDPDSFITPDDFADAFVQQWPVFVQKLFCPPTDVVRQFGEWAPTQIKPVMQRLFHDAPLTVIHNDFQADNLLFGRTPESTALSVIDWQLVGRGRGPVDLAYLFSGSMDPDDRRQQEGDLLRHYVEQLDLNGIRNYTDDECLVDYRAALLLPPVRLACAVGMNPQMVPGPDAFWDVLFARQIRALIDHGELPY